jgi:hypothetical protein
MGQLANTVRSTLESEIEKRKAELGALALEAK